MKVEMPKTWKLPSQILQRPDRTYFHVRLPYDLLNWIKSEAEENGITGTQLVEETLTDYRTWVEQNRGQAKAR